MNHVDVAIHKTVHDNGGAEHLSQFLACRPGTLNNKADPGCETHYLGVQEAIVLQLVTRSRKVVRAEAEALGGVFVQGHDWSGVSDQALLDAWAHLQEQHGGTARVIRQSLDDGMITREELRSIKREMFEDFRAAMELYKRLEGLCDEPADDV